MNAPVRTLEPVVGQVIIEIRHLWLRLEIAQTELNWAVQELAAGRINEAAALQVLEEVVTELIGEVA